MALQNEDFDDWVAIAGLVRTQGRKGELLAEILTDFPERFNQRKRVFLRSRAEAGKRASVPTREVKIERHWMHKGRVVLKFAGVDDMNTAELLRGLEVVIPREERAPLDDDAVYIADLVGCLFYDRATRLTVGEVVNVDRESTSLPLLIVHALAEGEDESAKPRKLNSAKETLVPFAKAYKPKIDLEARRMEMTLPDGLLELYAPAAEDETPAVDATGKSKAKAKTKKDKRRKPTLGQLADPGEMQDQAELAGSGPSGEELAGESAPAADLTPTDEG